MWWILALWLLVASPSWAGQLDATWQAPTVNTDGSPITEPLTYRIYYFLFPNTPCPGTQFIVTAPDVTVAKLTGLTTGLTYNVQATAVNAGGNESPCSNLASAAARADGPLPIGSALALSFVQGPTAPLVSGITVASGKAYSLSTMTSGAVIYIDRSYTATTVPARAQGLVFIRTANDDKARADASFLTFTLGRPATVLVAYVAGVARPSWLAGWFDTGLTLGTTDVPLRLYERAFPAGVVTLGGNSGAESMYLVIVQ